VVERVHGCHAFPDTMAIDKGDNPQWLYTVVFEARSSGARTPLQPSRSRSMRSSRISIRRE